MQYKNGKTIKKIRLIKQKFKKRKRLKLKKMLNQIKMNNLIVLLLMMIISKNKTILTHNYKKSMGKLAKDRNHKKGKKRKNLKNKKYKNSK